MNDHRYILEPYKGMNSRQQCPSCESVNKSFSLYIETETGQHVHPTVGRCNRESNCGYHYTPKQYFKENPGFKHQYAPVNGWAKSPVEPQKETSYIPFDILNASLKGYDGNHFVAFLNNRLGMVVTNTLISKYFIGSSKHWAGATVFYQIDSAGKIRTGKIMVYDPTTGKRMKSLELPVYWVHKAIKHPDFVLKQCLFGEHLLIDKTKPVAIVESEKTAIIASAFLPEFIWLAAGSLNNLSNEKCAVLKGRLVTLYPDLNGFEKWTIKAKELSRIAKTVVSDLLEQKASDLERQSGLDLADYLLRFNYNEFIEAKKPIKQYQLISSKNVDHDMPATLSDQISAKTYKSKYWDKDINDLQSFFLSIQLPMKPITLDQLEVINDVGEYIKRSFRILKANLGNQDYLHHLITLFKIRTFLVENNKK